MQNTKSNISNFDRVRINFYRFIRLDSIRRAVRWIKILKNFWEYYFVRLGLKKQCVIRFRNGESIEFSNDKLKDLLDLLTINGFKKRGFKVERIKNGFIVNLNGVKFKTNDISELNVIKENFIDEQYNWLNAKDRQVVDIGANIGDTAVYFSKIKKAKKVIAFEPYPYAFNLAKKNVRINKLKNVALLNQGVGGKRKFVTIKTDFVNTEGSNLKIFNAGKRIRIVTLEDIVKKYDIKKGVLKMDCEGCEYQIILNANNEVLRKFNQIMVECHYGYKNIERKLKDAGFKVYHSKVHYNYNKSADDPKMFVNIINAKF